MFEGTELSYILGKVYSEPQHIQNHDIFRTMTMAYLGPDAYSEHGQISMMERFATLATQRTFLYFEKWNFLAFPRSKSKKTPL